MNPRTSPCAGARVCLGIALGLLGLPLTAHSQSHYPPTVILDPGHGGKDAGAHHGGVSEKSMNLRLALAVERALHELGINTAITRADDRFLSLDQRARYARHFANPVFVSIHYNGATRTGANGIETFHANNRASREFAIVVQHALLEATGATNRGVKNGSRLRVLRSNAAEASILVEGGFLSNPQERARIAQPHYQQHQASAIASGIHAFLSKRSGPKLLPAPSPSPSLLVSNQRRAPGYAAPSPTMVRYHRQTNHRIPHLFHHQARPQTLHITAAPSYRQPTARYRASAPPRRGFFSRFRSRR